MARLLLDILNNGKNPNTMHKTFNCLVPKGKNTTSPKGFKPISLCKVIMKIVKKCNANKLRPLLPDIINEEQNVFVMGGKITDNVLIAMECFHCLKKTKKAKNNTMALKLDMSKACDRMKCKFIKIMLHKMGFSLRFISLIMRCITSISYQILIKGQPSRSFEPERGLRQRDSLTPYVFILCENLMPIAISYKVRKNKIHGLKVA